VGLENRRGAAFIYCWHTLIAIIPLLIAHCFLFCVFISFSHPFSHLSFTFVPDRNCSGALNTIVKYRIFISTYICFVSEGSK
jgi:hypothetical protein